MRVLVVDDHPAVRIGLTRALRGEPGVIVVGAVGLAEEGLKQAKLTWPDVVLVDYHLPDSDGLALCQQLKSMADPPAVLLYSAFADGSLAIATQMACADGLLNKAATIDELIDALRTVARGGTVLPSCSPAVTAEVAAALDDDDLPILGMVMNGITQDQISDVLQLTETELATRTAAIVDRIKAVP